MTFNCPIFRPVISDNLFLNFLDDEPSNNNEVDGKDVPIPHFGIILEWDDFDSFSSKLKTENINFIIEPYLRFSGLPGEQKTMFFKDPFGNALEFKSFKQDSEIFNK